MAKPSKKAVAKPILTLKPFDEIYNDYLKSSKSEDNKLQLNKDIQEVADKYDVNNPDPIFDSAETLLNIVIKEKDWDFLYYLLALDLELGYELFYPQTIQRHVQDAGLEDEWYDFLKDYYHSSKDNTDNIILYISYSMNINLFKKIFSKSEIQNMVQNNTPEYQKLLRIIRNRPEFSSLFRKYMDYDSKELDLICKSDENQYLPFENISYNIIIPITYYVEATDATHIVRTNSLIHLDSIMNYTFEKADYNIGLMKYLDVDGPTIDKNFFKKNQTFLKETLSTKEIFMLSGYTFNGDVLANLFLKLKANVSSDAEDDFNEYVLNWRSEKKKNKHRQIRLNSLFYQLAKRLNNYDYDFVNSYLEKVKRDDAFIQLIKECVEEYVDDLKKIFDKAPALDEDMVVFRGVSTMYYKKDNSDKFYNNTFMSTSLNPNTALDFSAKECCLKKITLKRGFNKIIFIEPITQIRGEYELLIPPDTEFRILKHEEFKKETTFDYDHIKDQGEDKKYKHYLNELCRHPVSFKTFTTMESV
jgi:hypothetical protein